MSSVSITEKAANPVHFCTCIDCFCILEYFTVGKMSTVG